MYFDETNQPRNALENVQVGDTIRFSTAILQRIHEDLGDTSMRVRVTRIVRDDDGALSLWLTNVEAGR